MMTKEEVLIYLKEHGTTQNQKIYKNHGATHDVFGVSFYDLKQLKKQVKKKHALAMELWNVKNEDVRIFASMIMDSKQLSKNEIQEMILEINYYVLLDSFVKDVVYQTNYKTELMEEWIQSDLEYVGRAGYLLVALHALNHELTEEKMKFLVYSIKKDIHNSKNRKQQEMLNALIAIGMQSDELKELVYLVVDEIGEIKIDHGDTACKTPDVKAYIEKANRRRK